MNRSLAQWLAGNPVGAVFVTGLLGLLPLLGVGVAFFLPGAVPALIVLVRGERQGVVVAAGASLLLTRITAATAYRMSATGAYARIVEERLASFASSRVAGFQSLQEFTQRRLLPATRTCASFSARLESLSVRVERATSLLRTQVEMLVQEQNAALLTSMDNNAERQLRLQRVVEGLSVVAVSYYAVGLLAYVLHAIAPAIHVPDDQLVAGSVIPVFLLVWTILRRKVNSIVGMKH